MNARVFIVKIPEFFDTDDGRWKPKFIPREADNYGLVKVLIPNGQYMIEDEISFIEDGLKGFSENDYLVLMGSPIQMGIATHIAMVKANGNVRFLIWDRKGGNNGRGQYKEVHINLITEGN